MRPCKVLLISVIAALLAPALLSQTQPNLENGWKPFGSYEGSHLDTVNNMNGNLMFHAPLTADAPQRGAIKLSNVLFSSSKDWQAICTITSLGQESCKWQKGGGSVALTRSPALTVHRTLNKQYTGGSGITTFAAYGYSIVSEDGTTHLLHGVAGTEDSTGEPAEFDSLDLSGYHLKLVNPDTNLIRTHFVVTDRSGNRYEGDIAGSTSNSCGRIQFAGLSTPASGRAVTFDDAPSGDQYCSQQGFTSLVTDANGNQLNFQTPANSTPTTDTLGKAPPLSTGTTTTDYTGCVSSLTITGAQVFFYQDPNGVTQQIKLCEAELSIQTAFNQVAPDGTPIGEAVFNSSTTAHYFAFVTAVLGDGSRYTFGYDNYGLLTNIGLPTGGSISYTWTTINFINCNLSGSNVTRVSRAVASRTLNDGQGHSYTWHYFWGTPSPTSLTNYVTDPLGNDTVHVFTEVSSLANMPASCRLYETSTITYQGSQAANQPLQRLDTGYSASAVVFDSPDGIGAGDTMLANVFATDVTTTLYTNGAATKIKKVHKEPDPGLGAGSPIFGNTVKQTEYDWGPSAPGPLLRETDTVYQWQKNSGYRTAGMLDLPASVVVVSPNSAENQLPSCPVNASGTTASCISETDYLYDETAYLTTPSPAISTQHVPPPNSVRGNQSTVTRRLTASSNVVSHVNWYDTGEPFQKSDGLGHTTTLTYDPFYVGAYATQTCSPSTNSGSVSHCVSGTYDFNTGVLKTFTNDNATTQASGNTQGDSAHTSTYAYDLMFRVTSATAPPDATNGSASSQNLFTYSPPNTFPLTVTRQRSVTNSMMDSVTSSFDGLGRVFRTQHSMPSGPPSTVDTTFDQLGRVATVSNPYFSSSDATYGITQTVYDALDRPLLAQKPDGSYSTVTYRDNCTTTQDEIGNPRRSCSDGIGRLSEVDEPGDANAPAATDTSNTDTSATGSLNISGSDQVVVIPPPKCPPRQICDQTPDTIYDAGSVTAIINGHATSATYGQGDNASSVALHLANAINADGAAAANASASGSLITLTARNSGSGGDYTLSFSTTYDSGDFTGPSFSALASGFRLLGGSNGSSFQHAWITQYQYDANGNLACVEQHGSVTGTGCSASASSDASSPWRVRRFAYDSFSRLLTAHNPESGTITYAYDLDGNLLQKTSPAPNQTGSAQTISYCYDELHRVTGKAYSAQTCQGTQLPAGTAAVTYTYDSGTNAKGKLTGISDQAGTASYTYDVLGRLATETRVISGISKNISYDYNLDGSLKALHYPSGAVVTYTPDSAGRLLFAVDSTNNINYVTGATYQADGQMTGFVSGNGGAFAGITNSFSYNKRLQPVNMSASAPSQTVFSIGYDFHVGNGTTGADNGNVWGITNYRDNTRNQSFTYDALNRLTSAQNAGTDCTVHVLGNNLKFWGNTYTYDPWGNLTNKTKITTACSGENLNINAGLDNKISSAGYAYDAAGNMTTDGTEGVSASYDQENRIVTAARNGVSTSYTYDADGNRVKKLSPPPPAIPTSATLYWYMTPGIVAESDQNGTLKSEYIFFNGERVARRDGVNGAGGVFYYFSDHLKTASVITDAAGNIKAESDYYPWGGELQFVANDSNHYKFTGKERDTETNLDYFGARYYSNGLGRFITPDWSATPIPVPYADLTDPQSLNQYSYVRNIPTTKVDLDGHGCPPECDVEPDMELVRQTLQQLAPVAGPALASAGPVGLLVVALGGTVGVPLYAGAHSSPPNDDQMAMGEGQVKLDEENQQQSQPQVSTSGAGARKGGSKPYDDTPENLARMAQGKPPIGRDGKPVELHSANQTHKDQSQELTRTDHRGKGNFKKNHQNTGQQRSLVNRNQAAKDRRAHWKKAHKEKKKED